MSLSKLHAIILTASCLEEINIAEALEFYINIFLKENKMEKHIIYAVGNKVDNKENRKVFKDEIMKFINRYSLNYFETSAYTGENINEVFENILNLSKIYTWINFY